MSQDTYSPEFQKAMETFSPSAIEKVNEWSRAFSTKKAFEKWWNNRHIKKEEKFPKGTKVVEIFATSISAPKIVEKTPSKG